MRWPMGAGKIADVLVSPDNLEKNAYAVDTIKVTSAPASSAPAGPSLEPVMGLLADPVAGQKVFKNSSCHSVIA